MADKEKTLPAKSSYTLELGENEAAETAEIDKIYRRILKNHNITDPTQEDFNKYWEQASKSLEKRRMKVPDSQLQSGNAAGQMLKELGKKK